MKLISIDLIDVVNALSGEKKFKFNEPLMLVRLMYLIFYDSFNVFDVLPVEGQSTESLC
jgi:hypothetical protein